MTPSASDTIIIGIDCATDPRKIGLARAELSASGLHLTDVERGGGRPVQHVVKSWLRRASRGLITLDSPLGWSSLLAESLPDHQAGQRLVGDPNRLFHRLTDDFVYEKIGGSRPLEVGANLIARTAHATLGLLASIRTAIRQEIPLAWEPELPPGVFAIEVYPAATLRAIGIRSSGYKAKAKDQIERREEILAELDPFFDGGLEPFRPELLASADTLDAVVCTLAGADFLRGLAMRPTIQPEIAWREGWIWVRPRSTA